MSVVLLSQHKEARKAAPAVIVERITESTYRRWQTKPGAPCTWESFGAKGARRVCSWCLPNLAKSFLERPAGEAERIEAEKVKRMCERQAIADAKKAHDASGLCEASNRKNLSGLCERPPKFLVETPCSNEKQLERLCAHHTAPWRRKLVSEYVRMEYADGTVGLLYNHHVEKRLRRIEPLLKAVAPA